MLTSQKHCQDRVFTAGELEIPVTTEGTEIPDTKKKTLFMVLASKLCLCSRGFFPGVGDSGQRSKRCFGGKKLQLSPWPVGAGSLRALPAAAGSCRGAAPGGAEGSGWRGGRRRAPGRSGAGAEAEAEAGAAAPAAGLGRGRREGASDPEL